MTRITKDDHPERYSLEDMKSGESKGQNTRIFSEDFCVALDSSNFPIYIIEPQTFEVVYANQALCQAIGKNPLGCCCYESMRGKDAPCSNCSAMRLYQEGQREPKEFRHSTGRWVLVQASPLRWKGRDFIKLTCVDITEQKKMEEELRLRNKEYDAVVLQSETDLMRYDIAADRAVVNVDRNLNWVDEYTIENYSQVVCKSGMVVAESISEAKELLSDIRSGNASRGYNIRLSVEDAGLRWLHVDYVLIEDNEGRKNRAVVSFYDNTEQREKELAYQNWNSRLDALMDERTSYLEVNLSQDIIEASGRMGSWNQGDGSSSFNDFVGRAAQKEVFMEDVHSFWRFFNRERLIGLFYAGTKEDSLEYRAVIGGETPWYKAEVQMVSVPFSSDVKAFVTFSDVDANVRERERLLREAESDSMTGLYNRAASERLIRKVLGDNTGERCCFLIIDLDDLRDINSNLGHPEGDRALKAIAEAMKAQFRRNDILGRIGGDEFVVLLRNVPEGAGLRTAVSNFMKRIRKIHIGPMGDRAVHASVGGSFGVSGKDNFQTLYEQADLALYYTKATGKNAFNFYVPEMENREFLYKPRSTVTMTREHWYESEEFKKLLQALAAFFPLVISVNLTQNTYYMMEYMAYTTQRARDEGVFDQLIADGAGAYHPEDRQSFLDCFGREKLLKAHAEGKRIIGHKGRQLGDDGIYRWVRTVVVFMEEETSGDVCEITFAHVAPPETEELD